MSPIVRAPPSKRQVAAIVAGNALEFYDFLTFSFFAVQIGQTFFPKGGADLSLLATLATFWVGFAGRPVGALVIGRIADRRGRKPAMLLTFGLMGLGITGLALTPGYAQIGYAGAVLAVAFRLIQGFALGGEVGSSTAFLIEAAPPRRRGLYVSLQYMGQDAAALTAGVLGFALAHLMPPHAFSQYGWRIAFLVGASIVPFGLILRRGLVETLHDEDDAPPVRAAGSGVSPTVLRIAVLGFLMLAAGTVATYTLDYVTTYAADTLHMAVPNAFVATVVIGLTGVLLDPVGGLLSDRFGRKPVMMIATAAMLLTIGPSFWLLVRYHSVPALMAATGVMSVCSAIGAGAVLISITESLPRRVRAGSLSLIYATAISIFGGSVMFTEKALTRLTGDPMAPAWYMGAATLLGLIAMTFLPETAPVRVWAPAATPAPAPA